MDHTSGDWVRLRLRVVPGLTPFELPSAREIAVGVVRDAAERVGATLLALAVLPNEIDILLAPDQAGGGELPTPRRGLTTRLNRLLGRSGRLFEADSVDRPSGEWQAVAEAIEQRGGAVELDASTTRTRRRTARRPEPTTATVGDVIRVAEVSRVVQLAAVTPLLERLVDDAPDAATLEAVREYTRRWFVEEPRTLATVRTVLGGLARAEPGGGYFVSGLYGAGKSHLLAVCALAAEAPLARRELFGDQPDLADLALGWAAAGRRLAVCVALDEQPPAIALEEAVFRAAEQTLLSRAGVAEPLAELPFALETVRAHLLPTHGPALDRFCGEAWTAIAERDPAAAAGLAQRYVTRQRLPFRFAQSRVERLGRLRELADGAGFSGVVILLDELGTFLTARGRRGRAADASFLQFLGQRAGLEPLWVVATLQTQIEAVGDLEHRLLRQIKDRYETRLSLPLATSRMILARKVLPRRDGQAAAEAVAAALAVWRGPDAVPGLTAAALAETYPLHPLTFEALEATAERFLAQTRSLIEFAATRVRGDELAPGILDRPWTRLLLPDELWLHFQRDLVRHPELRVYHDTVAAWYERNLRGLLDDPADEELAQRLVRCLLVLGAAGLRRAVGELAAAVLPYSPERLERVTALLELLRRRGDYLRVERRDGRGADVYHIDCELDAGAVLRRRADALLAGLADDDARLHHTALAGCGDAALPLAAAVRPHSVTLSWLNTPRAVALWLRDLTALSGRELANQASLLAGGESAESVFCYLAEPRRLAAQRAAFAEAVSTVRDQRWRHSLLAWIPREPTAAERQALREDVARELLRADPSLTAEPTGREVLARLDEEAADRAARLGALMRALYRDGEITGADGPLGMVPGSLAEQLEAAVGVALGRLFPRFAAVSPRQPPRPPADIDDLVEHLIVPGAVSALPASILARAAEAIALPLGLAAGELGAYEVSIAADGPAAALIAALPDRPIGLVEAQRFLAKSEWGLTPPLAELVVAALLRRGYLIGLDDQQRPAELRAPLRAAVALIRPAALLAEEEWRRVGEVAAALLGREPGELNAATQQDLHERLGRWRAAALTAAAALTGELPRAAAGLGADELAWRDTIDLAETVADLARGLPETGLPADALRAWLPSVATLGALGVAELWRRFRQADEFARTTLDRLRVAGDRLRQAMVPSDSPLAARRDALLAALALGDDLLSRGASLVTEFEAWRADYAAEYAAWHARVHAAERFAPYDAFRGQPAMRVLANLSRLKLDAPDAARDLAEALFSERRRQCRRTDLRSLPPERLTCPDCGVLLGETIPLRPVVEFETAARRGITALLAALVDREDRLRASLADLPDDDPRLAHIDRLLRGGEPAELLDATSFSVIDLLNCALTDDAVATRRLDDLRPRLSGKRLTKGQVHEVVEQWLDPRGRLGPDDRLAIDE